LSSLVLAAVLVAPAGVAAQAARVVPDSVLDAAVADTLAPPGRAFRAAETARPAAASPRNPTARWSSAPDGCASLRYVVGADGRVEAGAVAVAQHSDPALAAAALRILPRWRYVPAERPRGQPVRQLVELTVVKRGMMIDLALSGDRPEIQCPTP
jgi:outer membrane biosynthesis protein TonB